MFAMFFLQEQKHCLQTYRFCHFHIQYRLIQWNVYYLNLLGEQQLGLTVEGSGNGKPKITGFNGVRKMGFRLDN